MQKLLCRVAHARLPRGQRCVKVACKLPSCRVYQTCAERTRARQLECKLHACEGGSKERCLAETCQVAEGIAAKLHGEILLHQEFMLLGKQNKKKKGVRRVDLVVQGEHGFVAIEVHGSKEHYEGEIMQKDQKKAELWDFRMPGESFVTIHMPERMGLNLSDGSWHAYVWAELQPKVSRVL